MIQYHPGNTSEELRLLLVSDWGVLQERASIFMKLYLQYISSKMYPCQQELVPSKVSVDTVIVVLLRPSPKPADGKKSIGFKEQWSRPVICDHKVFNNKWGIRQTLPAATIPTHPQPGGIRVLWGWLTLHSQSILHLVSSKSSSLDLSPTSAFEASRLVHSPEEQAADLSFIYGGHCSPWLTGNGPNSSLYWSNSHWAQCSNAWFMTIHVRAGAAQGVSRQRIWSIALQSRMSPIRWRTKSWNSKWIIGAWVDVQLTVTTALFQDSHQREWQSVIATVDKSCYGWYRG